jgi:acyl-CoA thioester hydrolase
MSDWMAEIEYVVPFHDLDPLGVVWHGNYVKYFELVRTELLRSIDFDYPQMRKSGYAWPVVDLRARYPRPLTYQQRVSIRARVVECECRLRIRYEIRDRTDGGRVTHGETTQVAVKLPEFTLCLVSPPILLEKLRRVMPCG